MKKRRLIFLILIMCFSCKTDFSDLGDFDNEYDVLIVPTGNSNSDYIEFKFLNTSDHTLWYRGMGKESPIYSEQILSDSGWVSYIWWRCLTGSNMYKLAPYKSLKSNVPQPDKNAPWRVGLLTRRELDGENYYNWSDIQY